MKVVISSGHGLKVRGASGVLDEVNEARRVVERVADYMRSAGHVAQTFHDNTSTNQNTNLQTIVNYHNSQIRDNDISVHFNAYQTTSKPMGTETLYVSSSGQTIANRVSPAIASAGAFINRGAKKRTDLYFLNKTNKPAILIEVCFVDSSADADLYRRNFETICVAIASSITQTQIPTEPPTEPTEPPVEPPTEPPPVTGNNRIEVDVEIHGHVSVTVNDELVAGHDGCEHAVVLKITKQGDAVLVVNGEEFHNYPEEEEEVPPTPAIPLNQTNIICTVFGGANDPNNSAYPPYAFIDDNVKGVALPWRFPNSGRPSVRVINRANNKEVVCEILDLGPWMIDDNYWTKNQRPIAEQCWQTQTPLPSGPNAGRVPNGAGIDVTPGAANAIGLSGKGNVDWDFVKDALIA